MAKFLTPIQFVATGSMDTPSPGFVAIYMNTDGFLYVKFSNGSEARLT
jgi:flagellar basal body rod protein FlgF